MSNSRTTIGNQEWAQVADKAKAAVASVGDMASHAAMAVGEIASQAAGDVARRANDLAIGAGVGIQELGDTISQRAPQTGVLGSASQAAARSVKDAGAYLEDAKLSGITEDVAQLIRRNPIQAVLLGVGVGWYLARKLRS